MKHDEMKLPSTPWNLCGNLADSPEQPQLLQQPGGDATADVAHQDGLTQFNSEYLCRIHAHISATDDDCLYIRQRPRKRRHKCARRRLLSSKVFVMF